MLDCTWVVALRSSPEELHVTDESIKGRHWYTILSCFAINASMFLFCIALFALAHLPVRWCTATYWTFTTNVFLVFIRFVDLLVQHRGKLVSRRCVRGKGWWNTCRETFSLIPSYDSWSVVSEEMFFQAKNLCVFRRYNCVDRLYAVRPSIKRL